MDHRGRPMFIADAHRDGKRFVVRADYKLTALLELGSQLSIASESRSGF
jgi:hypothetical protein